MVAALDRAILPKLRPSVHLLYVRIAIDFLLYFFFGYASEYISVFSAAIATAAVACCSCVWLKQ